MTAALVPAPLSEAIEQVLISGNLAGLTAEQRVIYYNRVCESVGLNPLTRPFEYITLTGKLVLYARRDCTDQLRKIYGVSIQVKSREMFDGVYVVTAAAIDRGGRSDESTGAVPIEGLKGEARANAMMKAETKAKRRVTLSICGLGMLDENEVDSVPSASAGPVQTAGTSHLPPRQTISGFESDGEEDRLQSEYTEPVDVIEPNTGEVVRREPRITAAQNATIHALLRDIRNQYNEDRYRKDLRKHFCKDLTDELSVREAARVIATLEKRRAKIAPELEAQERDSAEALRQHREAQAAAVAREPGSDDGPAFTTE